MRHVYDLDQDKPIPDEVGIDVSQRSAMAQFPGSLSDDDLQGVALTYLEYVRKGKDWPLACSAAILSVRRALSSRGKIISTAAHLVFGAVEQAPNESDVLQGPDNGYWGLNDVDKVSSLQPDYCVVGIKDTLATTFPAPLVGLWEDGYTDTEIAAQFGVARMTAWRWRQKAQRLLAGV